MYTAVAVAANPAPRPVAAVAGSMWSYRLHQSPNQAKITPQHTLIVDVPHEQRLSLGEYNLSAALTFRGGPGCCLERPPVFLEVEVPEATAVVVGEALGNHPVPLHHKRHRAQGLRGKKETERCQSLP